MIRLQALPYFALAAVLAAVTIAVFLEPFTPRLRRALTAIRHRVRAAVSSALVAADALGDRRRRAGLNGGLTAAELEAVATVELDREARQS